MTDDDIARLRGLAQAAKEAEAAYRALPSDAGADDVMRLGHARNSALLLYENATEPDVLLRLLDERDALRRERDAIASERDAFRRGQLQERLRERDAAMALLRSFTADGYRGGTCSSYPYGGGKFTLFYSTIEQAERAFDAATAGPDALLGGDKGA